MKRFLAVSLSAVTLLVGTMSSPRQAQAYISSCVSNCSSVALTGCGACVASSLICGPAYEACYTACIIPVAFEYGRCLGGCNGGGGGGATMPANPNWGSDHYTYDLQGPVVVNMVDTLGQVLTTQGTITGVKFYLLNLDTTPLSTLSDTTAFENRPWQFVGDGAYIGNGDWYGLLNLPGTINGIILRYDFADSAQGGASIPGMTALMPTVPGLGVPTEVLEGNLRLLAAPNPSFGRVTLSYSVPKSADVTLGIYDLSGRLIRTLQDGALDAGAYSATWDGLQNDGVRSHPGTYFVRLRAGDIRQSRTFILLQ